MTDATAWAITFAILGVLMALFAAYLTGIREGLNQARSLPPPTDDSGIYRIVLNGRELKAPYGYFILTFQTADLNTASVYECLPPLRQAVGPPQLVNQQGAHDAVVVAARWMANYLHQHPDPIPAHQSLPGLHYN